MKYLYVLFIFAPVAIIGRYLGLPPTLLFLASSLAVIPTAGILGHSEALVADAVESFSDIAGSFIVWRGLAIASLPGFTLPGDISASDRYYKQDVTHERFTLNDDSTITVPTAPGLGVLVDEARVRQFAIGEATLSA